MESPQSVYPEHGQRELWLETWPDSFDPNEMI